MSCLLSANFQGLVFATTEYKDSTYVYNPDSVSCADGTTTASTSSGGVKYISKGIIPKEGMQVGATTYGGMFSGGKWVSTNTNQGVYPGKSADDNGMTSFGPPMAGSVGYAELAGSGKKGTVLGNLPRGTKLKISYKGKYVIAEKRDVGYGGGNQRVRGKIKAVDLWWEVAAMLDFKGGSDIVTIHAVDDNTPLTESGVVFDKASKTLTKYGGAIPDGAGGGAVSAQSFDEACCPEGSGSITPTSVSGANNKEKVWNFLIDRGLSPEQAAGVMGNLQQESGFDPLAQNPSSGAWGLAQWYGSRKTAILTALKKQPDIAKYADEKYADAIEKVPQSDKDKLILFELTFLEQESKSRGVARRFVDQFNISDAENEWSFLRKLSSVKDATVFWHNSFEISEDSPSKVLKERGGFADNLYKQLKDSRPAGSGGVCASVGNGSLQDYVLKYAHHEYHKAPFLKMTPAYRAAVDRAIKEGRYVGGGDNPGIDCGGFVTTLVHDSGFEPNYNYGSKTSKGASNCPVQKRWLDRPDSGWKIISKKGKNEKGKTIYTINVADLRPGDVAFKVVGSRVPHTFIFVGKIDGFERNIASASFSQDGQGWRTPMAGKENPAATNIVWYRKVNSYGPIQRPI